MLDYNIQSRNKIIDNKEQQAEAEILPSSSLVEVEVGVEVEMGLRLRLGLIKLLDAT